MKYILNRPQREKWALTDMICDHDRVSHEHRVSRHTGAVSVELRVDGVGSADPNKQIEKARAQQTIAGLRSRSQALTSELLLTSRGWQS